MIDHSGTARLGFRVDAEQKITDFFLGSPFQQGGNEAEVECKLALIALGKPFQI